MIFSLDSRSLLLAYRDGGVESRGLIETLSTATWEVEGAVRLPTSVPGLGIVRFVGYTADSSTLVVVGLDSGGAASIKWLDATTFEIERAVDDAQGGIKSFTLSEDGSLLATGSSDGTLRVWDARTGALLQQMTFGSQVQGVAFIDDRRLVVTPETGDLLIMTIDPAELERIVRQSLSRGFTNTECSTYGIAPCPTLDEMRGG